MKLWLDDKREAPEGWEWAQNNDQAWDLVVLSRCTNDPITHMSLDHDLGDPVGGDADEFLNSLVDGRVEWPKGIRVHSSNPPGRDNLLRTIDRYSPYPLRGYGNIRGTWEE